MSALHDIVKKGATDRSVTLRIIDSTDGTPETGVVFNTSGIDLWYRREGATKTSITEADLATPALDDPHLDGGFLHIGDGTYRLDLPDAAFATGTNHVDFGGTVTGMVVIGGRVRLVDVDSEDAVRAGLTALPNAAADAAGGLPVSDAGGLDLDALKSDTAAILVDTGTTLDGKIDAIDTVVDAILVDTAEIGTAGAGLTEAGGTGDQLTALATAAALATVDTNVDTLLTRITSTLFSGITSLAEWLGLLAGKQTGDATALTEIKATGAGSGAYDPTTDALEAIRDRGDAEWTTGAGGSPPDLLQSTTIATLASQTEFTLTAGSADDDAYNGALVVVTDQSTAEQKAVGIVLDYVGSTKTVTLDGDPGIFTMATGDDIVLIATSPAASAPSAAAIADAVLDEALSGHTTAGTLGKAVADIETDATAILVDTAEIGAAGAGLSAVPWNAAWDAEVQSEVTDGLNAYDPPTKAELDSGLAALNDLDAAGIRTAVGLASADLDTQLGTIDTGVDNLELGIIFGAAATGTLSTTQATTDLTGYADDQLIGRVIVWLSGACEGEGTNITDSANSGGLLTFTALTTAPGNGDLFKLI